MLMVYLYCFQRNRRCTLSLPHIFFKYNAIYMAITSYWPYGQAEPPTSILLHAILSQGMARKAITSLYTALLSTFTKPLAALREQWDMDLGTPLTDAQWLQATSQVKSISRNMRLRFTQFKYLHRSYLTPYHIAKMYPSASDACPCCSAPAADFKHMLWECIKVKEAWVEVIRITTEVVETPVPDTPESCLLRIRPRPKGSKCSNRFIDLAMTLYKRQIAMHWKPHTPPDIQDWSKVLLKWALAESSALQDGRSNSTSITNQQEWDQYIQNLKAKDDTCPP